MVKVTKAEVFGGHRDSVYSLLASVAPGRFFSAGADGLVVEWDLSKPDIGKLVARVGGSIYALAYDEQARCLWIGQNYEGIQLIRPESKEMAGSVKVTTAAIFDIRICENNAYLAFGDGVIGVMDTTSLAMRKHVKLSDKSVRALDLHAGGHLAVGLSDTLVRILDRASMTPLYTLKHHTNSVFAVQYSPDGKWLFTAGRDAHLKVWDVSDGYRLVNDVTAHMYAINHLTFSPDGSMFATCSMDKSIKLWDTESQKLLKVIDRSRHAGHATSVNKLLWVNDPDYLISASDDRMISVWEIES